jgi:uracil-DNA glycosylase
VKEVHIKPEFRSWQQAARGLAQQGIPPDEVSWVVLDAVDSSLPGLFETAGSETRSSAAAAFTVPRRFMTAAEQAAQHPDPQRWAFLYRILWRLLHEDRRLLERVTDPDVRQLLRMEQQAADNAATPGKATSARPFVPAGADLDGLGTAARLCTGCELYRNATQVVFGRGPANARLMLIGEQPGDQEDLQGAPFVGPAGEVLDRALADAGIARSEIYVTNVVKHFKWEPRGKRRIHRTPGMAEIEACRPWLEAELGAVRPDLIVCLGSTALQALMGPQFRVLKNRGRLFKTSWGPPLMATLHPSAILRIDDPAAAEASYRMIVEDLGNATRFLASSRKSVTGTKLPG